MNRVVEDTLNKLKQCDDFHNRCDCLLEHSEITYLLEYIQQKENKEKEIREYLQETINRWKDYEQFYEVVVEDKYILEILDRK